MKVLKGNAWVRCFIYSTKKSDNSLVLFALFYGLLFAWLRSSWSQAGPVEHMGTVEICPNQLLQKRISSLYCHFGQKQTSKTVVYFHGFATFCALCSCKQPHKQPHKIKNFVVLFLITTFMEQHSFSITATTLL